MLKLTVASYYRPSGENIHRFKNAKDTDKWGVSPDPGLEVKLTHANSCSWFLARRDRDREALAKGHRKTARAEGFRATRSQGQRRPGRSPASKDRRQESRETDKAASTSKARARSRRARSSTSSSTRRSKSSAPSWPQPQGARQPSRPDQPIRANARSDVLILLAIETTCDETGAAVLEGSAHRRRRRAAHPLERRRLAGRPARALRRRRARDRLASPRPPDPADDRRSPRAGPASRSTIWARSPWRPGPGWSAPWSSD